MIVQRWRMNLSESKLIARKSKFTMRPARAVAWELPGEKMPFAGVLKSPPKPRSAPSLSLVQAGSVSVSVSQFAQGGGGQDGFMKIRRV
jgi:hypothetical protein